MSGVFFREFKNIVSKDHLKHDELCADKIIQKICYLGDIDALPDETIKLCHQWFQDIFEFRLIERIIGEAGVFEEIAIHDAQNITKDKLPMDHPHPWSDGDIFRSLRFFCDRNNTDWNSMHHFASFNAKIGHRPFRFTLIHPSLNPEGKAKIFIRSHRERAFDLGDFGCPEACGILEGLVAHKHNVVISGAAGSGKTSLLTSLLHLVPPEEHGIIIEDVGEIRLQEKCFSYLVDTDSEKLKKFCAYALRMSPDRIILGEIRSAEVVPFILSANTGHKGMLSSVHANGAVDALPRLATLFAIFSDSSVHYEAIQRLIHASVEYVVHLERKRITEIIKIIGVENGKTIHDSIYENPPRN